MKLRVTRYLYMLSVTDATVLKARAKLTNSQAIRLSLQYI